MKMHKVSQETLDSGFLEKIGRPCSTGPAVPAGRKHLQLRSGWSLIFIQSPQAQVLRAASGQLYRERVPGNTDGSWGREARREGASTRQRVSVSSRFCWHLGLSPAEDMWGAWEMHCFGVVLPKGTGVISSASSHWWRAASGVLTAWHCQFSPEKNLR